MRTVNFNTVLLRVLRLLCAENPAENQNMFPAGFSMCRSIALFYYAVHGVRLVGFYKITDLFHTCLSLFFRPKRNFYDIAFFYIVCRLYRFSVYRHPPAVARLLCNGAPFIRRDTFKYLSSLIIFLRIEQVLLHLFA